MAGARTGRAGATSPGSLRGGVDYQVTVSGTWQNGDGVTADAECSRTDADATWRRDRSLDPYNPDADQLDILVSQFHDYDLTPDREDVRGEPATDTGDRCDATSHTYGFVWHADATAPLNLRVHDPVRYSNNSGRLRVEVKPYVETTNPDPQPAPVTAETVQVDSGSSSAARTSQSYTQGTRLLLTVKGSYLMRDAANWIGADAECTVTSDDSTWRSARMSGLFNGSQQPLGDVAVNGGIGTWYPKDGSGSCDEVDHEYTLELTTDRNGPLSFVVADDYYADNRGSVSVSVAPR